MITVLRDKCDNEIIGILEVKNIGLEEVQSTIDQIVLKFREDDIDWFVEGVLDELPAEWEWEFHMCCEIDSLWI